MVRFGLFLEHGCEITHNDAMRNRLREMGGKPDEFGWVSIQLDGGIEKAFGKTEHWFADRIASAAKLRRELVGIEQTRIGLMVASAPPPHVAAALALLTQNIVAQGGTLVMAFNSPLLHTEPFVQDVLDGKTAQPSLAYGQFAAKRGFHIMDAPSQHWVETLTGMGATGVELVLAYVDTFPQQAHPFIPVLEFTGSGKPAEHEVDLVVEGNAVEVVGELEDSIKRMLAGKIAPRTAVQDNSDFQITRALLGVTV
jgi:hypothetical protein